MENEKKVGCSEDIPPYPPKFRWKIDYKKCTLCCECIEACGLKLLEVVDDKYIDIIDEFRCPQCGDCAAACGQYAIVLT